MLQKIKDLAKTITINHKAKAYGSIRKASKVNGKYYRSISGSCADEIALHPFITKEKVNDAILIAEFKNGYLYAHNKLPNMSRRIAGVIDSVLMCGLGYEDNGYIEKITNGFMKHTGNGNFAFKKD